MLEKIHQHLIENEETLALAESCTGGHLSALFTSCPDASKYFLGAVVSYSDALKNGLLGVSREAIFENGAVSRVVAHEMWIGLMKKTGASIGISVTGVAGPSGGTKETPVGRVYLCIGRQGQKPHVWECTFEGDRRAVINATCDRALGELAHLLFEEE